MNFQLIKDVVANIIKTIEQTAVVGVNALKAHTFSTKVRNFPKTQAIKGTITVANQKKVEKELKASKKLHKSILNWLKGFRLPESIRVSNFPSAPKPTQFPGSFEISNFPKPTPALKNIRITNQPTAQLKSLNFKIDKLTGEVKKLKLDPKISVQTPKPERVIVPPANVTVKQEKIDYKKFAKLIPEPAKEFNYSKLAKMIANEVAGMAVSVGGGGGTRKEGLDDLTRSYNVCDKDVASAVKYYGFTGKAGNWYILKEDTDNNTYRYIKGSNKYATNWDDRVSLEYAYYHEIF